MESIKSKTVFVSLMPIIQATPNNNIKWLNFSSCMIYRKCNKPKIQKIIKEIIQREDNSSNR